MKRRSFLTGLLAAPAAPVVAKTFLTQPQPAEPASDLESRPVIGGCCSTVCAMTASSYRQLVSWDYPEGFDDEYDDNDDNE